MRRTLRDLPEEWPLEFYRGDTLPDQSFFVVDRDGNPLSGFTVKMQLRVLGTFVMNVPLDILGNKVSFNPQILEADPNVYDYDIEVSAGGKTKTLFRGTATVFDDTTKDSDI